MLKTNVTQERMCYLSYMTAQATLVFITVNLLKSSTVDFSFLRLKCVANWLTYRKTYTVIVSSVMRL